jgi:putative ABC transport system permease protein
VDPTLPLFFIQAVDGGLEGSVQQVLGALLGFLAIIAVVLAMVVLYAVTAHGVVERTHEIGVRMALGAQASHVVWLFVRRVMVQLAIGLALGLGGALMVGTSLQSYLVNTPAHDTVTLTSVAATLIVISVAACMVPARRATRVDPMTALRCG